MTYDSKEKLSHLVATALEITLPKLGIVIQRLAVPDETDPGRVDVVLADGTCFTLRVESIG